MGAEFLVAILWGVVVVYWAWSRRPVFGDSIGLFRHELHALANAAPARVPPANRRRPLPYTVSGPRYPLGEPSGDLAPSTAGTAAVPASLPAALAAAALSAKRLKARRRRRDVLCVLLAVVVVSALGSLARRSLLTLSIQALSDLALAAYAYLLVARTRASMARSAEPRATMARSAEPRPTMDRSAEPRSAEPRTQWAAPDEPSDSPAWRLTAAPNKPADGPAGRPATEPDWLIDLVEMDQTAAGHTPAHAMRGTLRVAGSRRRPSAVRRPNLDGERRGEAYGDFDSYASLALVEAN